MVIFSAKSHSQEIAYFNRNFHERIDQNDNGYKREYYIKDSIIEIKDFTKHGLFRIGQFSGFTDLKNLDEFIWFNSNNQYYRSPKLKLENRRGVVKYYNSKGEQTFEQVFFEDTVKFIQIWNKEIPFLTNGSGKYECNFEEVNEKQVRIFKDSIEIENYIIRTEKSDTIYFKTDTKAYPETGLNSFYEYLASNIDYPQFANFLGVGKKITIQFTVDENGNLRDFVPINNKSLGFEKKAIKKLEKAPKWIPATVNGRNVKTRFRIPLTFRH